MTDILQAPQTRPRRKLTGRYLKHTTCRFCEGSRLATVLDFGEVPLAGAFLKEEQIAEERFYPLQVCFCQDCTLVQVTNAIPADILFGNYFYFSSAIQTLVAHFEQFAQELTERFLTPGQSLAVEIGCNDGVFLKPLHARGVRCVGVDPAANVVQSIGAQGFVVINDCFGVQLAQRIHATHGAADAILSSYSFAHIDDMLDVMRGIKTLLKLEGVFIFEVFYLPTLLEELQYDMIYHEHFSYYSLMALQRFFQRVGMEIFDVKAIPGVRAGTMRFYVRNVGERAEPISAAVGILLAREQAMHLDELGTYAEFAVRVHRSREDLLELLGRLKRQGKRMIGYGASGRATTIMNFCGIDERYLDYVVDDAPAKQGCFTPGTHLRIKAWAATETPPRPDYALAFAWSFIDEVVRKRAEYLQQGGKFIVPLPRVRVIPE